MPADPIHLSMLHFLLMLLLRSTAGFNSTIELEIFGEDVSRTPADAACESVCVGNTCKKYMHSISVCVGDDDICMPIRMCVCVHMAFPSMLRLLALDCSLRAESAIYGVRGLTNQAQRDQKEVTGGNGLTRGQMTS